MAGTILDEALDDTAGAAPADRPATPAAPNPVLTQALDSAAQDEQARLVRAVTIAKTANPEQYQADADTAARFGVSTDFTARNRDVLAPLKTEADIADFVRTNPKIAQWYAGDDNPAAIKIDELRDLKGLDWLFGSAKAGLDVGNREAEITAIRGKQLEGKATPEEILRAAELSKQRDGERTFAADNWLQQGWVGLWQQAPALAQTIFAGVQEGVTAGAAVGTLAAVVGAPSGPFDVIPAAAGFAGGFAVGSVHGTFMSIFNQSAGQTYDDLLQVKDENGQSLDPETARAAAFVSGLGQATIESVGLHYLAKMVPGLDKLLGDGMRDVVVGALTRPTVREALKTWAGNTLKAGATEVTTEVAQQAVQIFTTEAAKLFTNAEDGTSFVPASPEDMVGELAQVAVQTAQIMTIMAPLLTFTHLGTDLRRANDSKRAIQLAEALNAHASESPLLKRLPGKMQDAINKLTADGPVKSLFVDPKAFQEFFQSTDDYAKFGEQTGLGPELAEATAMGRDAEVPIDIYYRYIAGSEIGETVKKHVKLSADGMSQDEATQFNEAWQETAQSLMDDFNRAAADEKQGMVGEERVFDDVKNKAMAAGITPDQAGHYAQLYATFFKTMGERMQMDAGALYDKYGLDIKRALPQQGDYKAVDGLSLDLDVIRAGQVEKFRKNVERAKGPSLLAFIRKHGGIEDTGGELAAMGLGGKAVRPAADKTGNMLGNAGSSKHSADYVARHAWESGYFPEFGNQRPTPNDLYDALREEIAGKKRHSTEYEAQSNAPDIARQAALVAFADDLDAAGIDANSLTDEEVRAALQAVVNPDPNSGALFQQETGKGAAPGVKRGSIQFAEGRTIINMFDQSNLSTFLHESGHFFLQVFHDLSTSANATPEIIDDWNMVKDYLGIDGNDIPESAHEKFARTFEAYLFEGKSPSRGMTEIMARFRSWMLFVYRQIDALRAPINDNVRGVMDRMLATDSEIKAMQTRAEFRPAFNSAEEAGMTPEQWKRYVDAAGRAVDRAKQELDVRLLGEVARQSGREWTDAKAEIKKAVKAEYAQLPVYQVLDYLRTGKSDLIPDDLPRMVLSGKAIKSIMGEGALGRMPRAVPPLYRAEGGVHPDVLAEYFGFQSGHDMLVRLMSAKPLGRAMAEEVALRMRARFGDLMGDANARVREAEAAIANDATGELLDAELQVLVRKGLVATKLNKDAARAQARRIIREKTIRDATRFKLYMAANAKAAAAAEKAILKGDWRTAIAEKKRQLLNHYMAMEARQAQLDTDKAVSYLSTFTGRSRAKGIDPEYLRQIEGLLERFDLRKSVSLTEAQRRQGLAAWIDAQEAQGLLVSVPDALRNDAYRKPFKEMTVDDLLTLRDAVQSIAHIGRLKDKLLTERKEANFRAVRDLVQAGIEASAGVRKDRNTQNPTGVDKFFATVRSIDAALLKIEQVVQWMDGGDINGPMRRYVWQPIANAEARENDMREKHVGKIFEAMNGLDPTRLTERITVPQVNTTFLRSDIMAVALNLGNAGNRERVLKAGNGKGPWTEADVTAITSHLNHAEWNAVQKMWDTVGELWPEVEGLQKRLTGVAPPRVEASPVVTPFGTLKGGYYPVIYDPSRAADVADRAAMSADRMFENTYLKPETRHGFTEARVNYARPILFDLDQAAGHLTAVIHDVTHREAVLDAHKIMSDQAVRATVEARYGREIYQQFTPWLQSIAHDQVKNDGLQGVNKVLRGIRSRATTVGMGFRISTMLTQLAGLSSATEMVSPRHMATGLSEFIRNPRGAWERVSQLSPEMRQRGNHLDRDLRDELRRMAGKHTLADDAKRFAFHGIAYMDRVVAIPTWIGAYEQHVASYPGDAPGAIAAGDRAVRLSQGSGGAKDLAAIQRQNEATKLITMFYSSFNAYYNRQRKWGRDAKRAIESGEFADLPSLLARQVFMTIGPAVIAELIVGNGPSSDENWAAWTLKKVALYPFLAVPIVRDAVNAIASSFGYTFTPAGRVVEEAVLNPIKLGAKIVQGKATAKDVVKQGINSAGYIFNLPLGQVSTTVNNVWTAIDEDDLSLKDFVLPRRHQ